MNRSHEGGLTGVTEIPDQRPVRALTLNCWGAPIAAHTTERMAAIGSRLAEGDYDLVALQEVFSDRDWDIITRAQMGNSNLKYFHRFKSGVIGSGLALLSKYPIVEASFQRFNSTGKW